MKNELSDAPKGKRREPQGREIKDSYSSLSLTAEGACTALVCHLHIEAESRAVSTYMINALALK